MIKVAHINTTLDVNTTVGGIVHQLVDDVRIRALGLSAPVWPGLRAANALRHRFWGNDGFAGRMVTRHIVSQLQRFAPDVVHLHNLHGYYLDLEYLFDYLNDTHTPVVATLHDLWALTGRCASPGKCDRWMYRQCDQCQFGTKYPAVWSVSSSAPHYKTELYGRLDAVLVVPSPLLLPIIEKSVLSHLPVTVIQNGIDRSVFSSRGKSTPAADALSEKAASVGATTVVIAAARRWPHDKGLHLMCRIADELPHDWLLVVVGNLTEAQKQLCRGHRLYFTGEMKAPGDMASLYNRADIVISVSLAESFGLTISEAAACHTVVAANADAMPRAYLPQGWGAYVSFADAAVAVKQLKRLRRIYPRQRPAHIVTAQQMRDAYFKLYQQILEGHAADDCRKA